MANLNPTGMDELEKTKWMISRVDLLHKCVIETFTNDNKKYENEANKTISKLKEWRNYFISPIGVGLTVLLGITPVFNFDFWTFFIILISLAGIGFVIFIFFTWLVGKIEQIYTEIDFIFNYSVGWFQMSNGFFITVVSDLTKVSFEGVNNYRIFTHLLLGAVLLIISNKFKKLSIDFRAFRNFKEFLESESKSYTKNIDLMSMYFQQFDKTKTRIHEELLEFVEETLKEYKPKDEIKTNG